MATKEARVKVETTKKAVRIKGAGRLRYEAEQRKALDATVAKMQEVRAKQGLDEKGELHPTTTGDAYLDSLPPERRAAALEARAKASGEQGVAGTIKSLGAIIHEVDSNMRAKATCPKCGKPTTGIVMAGETKASSGLCACATVSIPPAAAPVAAEQPKQEDEVMAKSKKTNKVVGKVVKASTGKPVGEKAAPCGKCVNCRNGAPQMCVGAPKASTATTTSKGAKAPAKRATAHPVAPGAAKERRPSALNLAADVLKKAGKPMHQKELAAAVIAAGWKTEGKTPASTLYAAIIREIDAKGKEARFRRGAEKGTFEFAG